MKLFRTLLIACVIAISGLVVASIFHPGLMGEIQTTGLGAILVN
jgi:hypothetical protein